MRVISSRKRFVVLLVTLLVVLGSVPGAVGAESVVAGTFVVDEGETVRGLDVVGATVVVRGTVQGDLNGAAADVRIEDTGVVTGDVNVAAASIDIAGRVGGDVNAGTATLRVQEGAVIAGKLSAGAADATIAGEIQGDVSLGADVIRLTDTAVVGGEFRYDADELVGVDRASIAGPVVRDESIGSSDFGVSVAEDFAEGVFAVYGFLVNLAVGAILLLVLPGFSRRVAETAIGEPAKSGGVGLLALIAVPVALVVIALTIIGIPITLIGAGLFALVAWVAVIYGRFAVGTWLVGKAGGDNRWLALVVGLLFGALFNMLSWVGDIVNFAVFLLGLGALALVLYDRYGSGRDRAAPATEDESTVAGEDTGGVPPA
ncbi:bactofilin family protein [Haloarchaeobius amylolyticus]|uniref:bactofilin family protein n=1 Tax=Haloarchaeobius amylolyticus TaxID=1198296 RepID=UPI00226ED99C|nr:polymer-forming cytoskeletal protein [Haloarchaeobius amylolyticus]